MILISDLNKLTDNHVVITDEEKNRDLGPPCRKRKMTDLAGQRRKTEFEFERDD